MKKQRMEKGRKERKSRNKKKRSFVWKPRKNSWKRTKRTLQKKSGIEEAWRWMACAGPGGFFSSKARPLKFLQDFVFIKISAYELKTNGEPHRGREENAEFGCADPSGGQARPGWISAGRMNRLGPAPGLDCAAKSSEKANPDRNRSNFCYRNEMQEGRKEAEFCLKENSKKTWKEQKKKQARKQASFFFHRKFRSLKTVLKNWFSNRKTRL